MERGKRKTRTGVVVSDRMAKTITVRTKRVTRHPLYGKILRKYKKFYVHDESLSERGLTPEDLVMDVEIVDDAGAAQIMQESGIVLPF